MIQARDFKLKSYKKLETSCIFLLLKKKLNLLHIFVTATSVFSSENPRADPTKLPHNVIEFFPQSPYLCPFQFPLENQLCQFEF